MSDNKLDEARKTAEESLKQIQDYDVNLLPREKELGSVQNFSEAVEPAKRLIGLFKKVSQSIINDLPESKLTSLNNLSVSNLNHLQAIVTFTPEQANAHEVRINMIKTIKDAYDPAFNSLLPFIFYSSTKTTDFQSLAQEARAMMDSISNKSSTLMEEINKAKDDTEQILENVREAAAEQGVSQQAVYFQKESAAHEDKAKDWGWGIGISSFVLIIYAMASFFIHKWTLLKPIDIYDSVQLSISKLLIFGVISYMLYLSVRNFLSHKHNAVVNKHRQNALMTYTTIVDAAKEADNKEVILIHAAACIFSPQATGYNNDDSSKAPSAKSVVELFSKSAGQD